MFFYFLQCNLRYRYLKDAWPNMLGDNFDFLYKQWNVHGKRTYEVMDQNQYFDTAIYIHADVSLINLFANYIVPDSNLTYNINDIRSFI